MSVSCLTCAGTTFVLMPCLWRRCVLPDLYLSAEPWTGPVLQLAYCMISWYDYLFPVQITYFYLDSFPYDL
jgi:hypothetical protein